MCKHGNVFSLAVLIGRGLDHKFWKSEYELHGQDYFLFDFEGAKNLVVAKNAPLAQLVEHLTLNQGVPGSNP